MSNLEAIGSRSGPTFSVAPVDKSDLWGIAKRGWAYALIGIVVGLAGGLQLLSRMPPQYKASTRMVLEQSTNDYLQSHKVTDGPNLGDDRYSQIHIVTSENVVLPVIHKLGLGQDAELGCLTAAQNSTEFPQNFLGGLKRLVASVQSFAGFKAPLPSKCDEDSTVLRAVTERLEVSWESNPLVINVAFKSRDPAKAAMIANAIAQSYIDSTLELKRNTAKLATEAMNERIVDLREQVANAERQVLEYKLANNIVDADPKSTTSDPLGSLNNQVANARIALLDARVHMDSASQAQNTEGWMNYVPDNELITKLRNQYIDIQTSAIDLENRVGKNHVAAVKLRRQMDEIAGAITAERKRIASSYAIQYEFAKAKSDELTSTLTQTLNEETANSKVNARLRELETAAQTLRSIYGSTLERIGEVNRLENGPVVLPYARVLTRASVPTQTESSKKRLLVLAASTLMGLLFGGAFAFGRNFPIGVFRTTDQVKNSLGLMSVVVPKVDVGSAKITEYTLDKPYSRFAESLRLLWSLISVALRESHAKIICVVTSVAGEGKTTVAANLANQISKHARVRTLLIDADFHQQSLTRAMAPDAQQGLSDALEHPEKFSDYVVTIERSGVDVLPCPSSDPVPNAAHLLGSKKMEALLSRARASYDLIIIEPPPIAVRADCRMLAPLCDGFVFVIEWGKTSQRLVLETFAEVHDFWERVLCVVLNKADASALQSIERYKGSEYGTNFLPSETHVKSATVTEAIRDKSAARDINPDSQAA